LKWKSLKKRCVLIKKGENCIKGFSSKVKPSSSECFECKWYENPLQAGEKHTLKETTDKAGNVIWN
jgi:hypothetical protein